MSSEDEVINVTTVLNAVNDELNRPKATEAEAYIESLPSKDDSKFRLNNKRVMVTYRTHIDKETLRLMFESKGQKLLFFRCAHETADSANPYEHTHAVVDFEKALQSCNCRVFDVGDIHPNIKTIKNNVHFTNCKKYLAKEDPANEDLKDCKTKEQEDKDKVLDIWGCKTASDALLQFGNTKNASQVLAIYNSRPEPKLELPNFVMKAWQVTLKKELLTVWVKYQAPEGTLEIDPGWADESTPMGEIIVWKTTSDGRNIIVIYNPEGCVGKGKFIEHMCENYPERFAFLQGIPPIRDLPETIKKEKARGWIGETILINLVRDCSDKKFYESLEALADGCMTSHKYQGGNIRYPVRNIVLFTNFMPKLSKVTEDRWDLRSIRPDGRFQRISIHDAKLLYSSEKEKRDNEKEQTLFRQAVGTMGPAAPTFCGISKTK